VPPNAATVALREKEVKSLLTTINAEVDRLPEGTMRALAPVLRQAERELEKDLTAWLKTLDGEERFTAQQMRVALLQVRRSLKAVEKAVPALRNGIRKGAARAAALAQQHIQREAAFFSVRFGQSLNPIPILEAGKIIRGTLLDRFDASVRRWPANVRANIRKRLAVSLVKHETVEQMQRRLVGRSAKYLTLKTPEAKARVVSRVLWSQAESDARRIVRTEVINAYNSVKLDMIDELASEDAKWGKRWDAALDGRTCPNCRALDHIIVKSNQNFPGNVDAPPLHPNCRCAVVAWHFDWEEKGSKIRFQGSYVPPTSGTRPSRSPRTKA
jgi:SPP1 gp7 family putative phage head morphogenesis protein